MLILLLACGVHRVDIDVEEKDTGAATGDMTEETAGDDTGRDDTGRDDTGRDDTGRDDTAEDVCYGDFDGDGWGGDPTDIPCGTEGTVESSGDCDDGDADTHPGAEDVCDNKDNDCDGTLDEDGEGTWYGDFDGDGWGGDPTEGGCTPPDGAVTTDGDCDDGDSTTYPGADEVCDDKDNDCDGDLDEGAVLRLYQDADGDGYGDPSVSLDSCGEPGWVTNDLDCNDLDASVNPGATDTRDGIDNNCDGIVDR